MIAIPNMRDCENCIRNIPGQGCTSWDCEYINRLEAIEIYEAYKNIVPCRECKHRPIKDDPDGADYGFNIVAPTDGDYLCPCLVEDGWYSWMPEDNFYCGRGERRSDENSDMDNSDNRTD